MKLDMATVVTVGGWSLLAVIVLAAGVAAFMALRVRKQNRADAALDAAADAKRWCDMLEAQLTTLSGGDDAVATRALSDAAALHAAAMSSLAKARTVEQSRSVRRLATDGLRYIAAARSRLGLVAGPQGPPPVAPDGRPMYEEGYWAAPRLADVDARNAHYEPRGRSASLLAGRVARLTRD